MTESAARPPIEIGVILAGELDDVDTSAVSHARELLFGHFREAFAEFDWRVELVWRRELFDGPRSETMPLIDLAREERDGRSWDFVFVVTASDLISHYKPFAFAAISSAADTAVFSTSRIDPKMDRPAADATERQNAVARRLVTLMRHAFGHFNGLDHSDDPQNVMLDIHSTDDLDRLADAKWSAAQRDELRENLALIADLRLEEMDTPRRSVIGFYAKSCWINRHEIADSIINARPWEYGLRLNRLTTATVSSSLILIITAETWEVALTQSPWSLLLLVAATFAATTAYITLRQQLLVRRERRVSEQSVITNVAAVAVVFIGMVMIFSIIAVLLVGVTMLLFSEKLIGTWLGLDPLDIDVMDYVSLAVFVASLSIIVGALGASFEQHHYFRHVTFVDEEV